MSKDDEALAMYESTLMRADHYEERCELGERIVLGLRRKLRTYDPSLPDEYEGPAWWPFEEEWSG